MNKKRYTTIVASGNFIPEKRVTNEDFIKNQFTDSEGHTFHKSNREIIDTFKAITTIEERRYADKKTTTSEMAYKAAAMAVESSGIDKESLDYIIVAHNFGDISNHNTRLDMVPSLAARVKHSLGIANPNTVCYDIAFGCPGWLQALIQADYFLRSGDANRALVIGSEILSRVSDPHDRDSMIYSDGAGAVIVEAVESNSPIGILAHATRSDTLVYSQMLRMGKSNRPDPQDPEQIYLKMNGRRLYQYALETVPLAIKECLDKAGIAIGEVKKVLIHQANGKMDDEILRRFYELYGISEIPEGVMPMTISWLGNSSVATIPTLYDLIVKGKLEKHSITAGDIVIFASVGAGMNINAAVYRAV
jgi:3-oxoacyl-[acyl-carrier-protein] synthase-3